MSSSLIFNAPFNSLSFGNVSYNIARELYKRKLDTYILPFGQPDISAYKPEPEFLAWLNAGLHRGLKKFKKTMPTLRLWHLSGSEFAPSDRQVLYTFHETDEPTPEELNIVDRQHFTMFSSDYSRENFEMFGAERVGNVGPGFDPDILIDYNKRPSSITNWILVGKWEKRKNTAMIIRAWLKKYANNPRHSLTLLVFNPFLHRQDQHAHEKNFKTLFGEDGKPFNVQIFNPLKTNAEINQLYNAADIDLSGIGSEGWGLPSFNMTALGKWSIVGNCTGQKDWATKENCVLIEPIGKQPCYDGVHFFKGSSFNQGNFYLFDENQVSNAMDAALEKAKIVNTEGVKLREKFSYSNTVDKLLEKLF